MREQPSALEVGDRAVDREDYDDAEVVVVYRHKGRTAAEYEIEALGETVAAVNPGYEADDDVVEAVYAEEAEAIAGAWRDVAQLRDAVAFHGLRSYSFPAGRLRRLDGEPDDADDAGELEDFL